MLKKNESHLLFEVSILLRPLQYFSQMEGHGIHFQDSDFGSDNELV